MKKIFVKSLSSALCLLILLSSFPYQVFGQNPNNPTNPRPQSSTAVSAGTSKTAPGSGSSGRSIFGYGSDSVSGIKIKGRDGKETNINFIDRATEPGPNGEPPLIPTTEPKKALSPEESAFADALGCTVGSILANAVTAAIYAGLSVLGNLIGFEVPDKNIAHNNKEVGLTIFGVPILPSWDSIGYCLANSLIVFIADSTIAWIQSGFEGKPVFVDDPLKFFEDLADREMSNFLETALDGALCEPFRLDVTIGLIDSYTGYGGGGRCTLDTIQDNLDAFTSGQSFSFETMAKMTTNPYNTKIGSRGAAQNNAAYTLAVSTNYFGNYEKVVGVPLSWRGKKGTPQEKKIITMGNVIEEQIISRTKMSSDRLLLAEKFDQVITALVNYLIKAALVETLNAFR